MIEIITHNTKNSLLELRVLGVLRLCKTCETLSIFETSFNNEISKLPRINICCADVQYRLKWNGDPYLSSMAYLELWHKSKVERKIATIKQYKTASK
jgi:hypothetical protein